MASPPQRAANVTGFSELYPEIMARLTPLVYTREPDMPVFQENSDLGKNFPLSAYI